MFSTGKDRTGFPPYDIENKLKNERLSNGYSYQNRSTFSLLHDPRGHSRTRALHDGPGFQDPRRKILHLLRPVVFALQVQAGRHGVRSGLAAAGRLRQDRQHDRRIDGQGTDETAGQTRRIPGQTRLAAASGNGGRRHDERPAGHRHLLRRLLHLGRLLLFEPGREMGL